MLDDTLGWPAYALSIAVLYLALVRRLRYGRSEAAQRKFPTRASYRDMTLEEAFLIQSSLAEVEFPKIFSASVFFALFKTYGIPSISHLLVATGQLANEETASKRAADTSVILTEVVMHHPSSQRAIDGIARMNYLHGRYRKSDEISDEDMLYTLSLFVLEPIRWTSRYEWREVNDVERCAMGAYWRFMGDAMEIPYTALKSHKDGWTDALEFLEELEEWSLVYEARYMVPAETNATMAKGTIDIALFNMPKKLHGAGNDLVSSLLEPRLRKAMMFNDPSWFATIALNTIVLIRKILLPHCFLPRPHFLRKQWFSDEANASGRFNADHYIAHPWYVKPTLSARWKPKALMLWLSGGFIPGDEGDKYMPDGYTISELGPERLRGKGEAEMQATREKLADNKKIGCPFSRW